MPRQLRLSEREAAKPMARQIADMPFVRILLIFAATTVATMSTSAGRVDTILSDGWTADGVAVTLPHTWNATDGADGRLSTQKLRVHAVRLVKLPEAFEDPKTPKKNFNFRLPFAVQKGDMV